MGTQEATAVAVVGGGRMGSGIAHAFLIAGFAATVIESDESRIAAAHDSVLRALHQSVDRGTATAPVGQMAQRLTVTTTTDDVSNADVAIEAVPESATLKATVLAQISAASRADAVIASNTSSLSISALAQHVTSPDRFLGLHFFNPVPASQLVEVVVGQHTARQTVSRAQQLVETIGKVAVTVNDSPGFASSRLGVTLGLEAIRMVEAQVASPADIDAAMTLGYKHPVGPLHLTDLVGLDVRLGIAEYLASTLGERFAPPQLLRDKVARGELGRKTGKGFFEWDTD